MNTYSSQITPYLGWMRTPRKDQILTLEAFSFITKSPYITTEIIKTDVPVTVIHPRKK